MLSTVPYSSCTRAIGEKPSSRARRLLSLVIALPAKIRRTDASLRLYPALLPTTSAAHSAFRLSRTSSGRSEELISVAVTKGRASTPAEPHSFPLLTLSPPSRRPVEAQAPSP